MKNLAFIFLWINAFLLHSQSARVWYEADFLPLPELKTTQADKEKMQKVSGFMDDYGEYLKMHEYVLTFTPDESYYQVKSMEMPDDVTNPAAYRISQKGAVAYGDFYQNRKTKKILNVRYQDQEKLILEDSLSTNHWQITGETKKIGQYQCIKAIWKCDKCKHPVEAWFTPEIPVPFGPAGYGGLPGLILELKKYRTVLRVKKIKWLKNKPEIIVPQGSKTVSRAEYQAMLRKKRMEIRRRARQNH